MKSLRTRVGNVQHAGVHNRFSVLRRLVIRSGWTPGINSTSLSVRTSVLKMTKSKAIVKNGFSNNLSSREGGARKGGLTEKKRDYRKGGARKGGPKNSFNDNTDDIYREGGARKGGPKNRSDDDVIE